MQKKLMKRERNEEEERRNNEQQDVGKTAGGTQQRTELTCVDGRPRHATADARRETQKDRTTVPTARHKNSPA